MEARPVILHGKQYWKVKDKIYVKSGDKLLKVKHFDADGKPVIDGVWSEETPNAAGGQDCTVHVECLRIAGTRHEIGKE